MYMLVHIRVVGDVGARAKMMDCMRQFVLIGMEFSIAE